MKNYNKKIELMLWIMIAFLAVFIRVYRFGDVPGGMNQDGAMAAVDAKALAEYGTDRLGMRYPVHLTAWGFGQMSALMSYLMAPLVKLLGLSVISARLPMLLVSLASLLLLYLFARDLGGPQSALAVFFFASINPWHIMQSRWALDCNLFPHFLLAGVFFLNRGISGKRYFLPLSMVFFAFSMYCYGISIYTVPVMLLASCVMLLCKNKIRIGESLGCAAVYFFFAWPFIVCMILNTFNLPTIRTPLFTIPYFPYSLRSSDILFFSEKPLEQLVINARSTLQILLQIYNGDAFNSIKGFGTMYVFSLPFLFLGMIILFRQSRTKPAASLIIIWFFTAVFEGLVTARVNINRINILFYPLIIFTGIGIYSSIRFCLQRPRLKAAGYLLPALWVIGFMLFSHTYFTVYADQSRSLFMEDFGHALTAIKGTDAPKVYISADAQYKGYSHVSEILTLFYLDIDAEYYQSSDFSERFTFKIPPEPDPGEDAVYVAAKDDLPLFDEGLYSFVDYGKFYVIVPALS